MVTAAPYTISFIVASIERDQELQQCITSIEKAYEHTKNVSVEILVVIQKTKQIKEIKISHPEIITIFYIDEIGLSVARNFAIAKSKGDYLVFLDDDATINEDLIDILLKNVKAYNKVNVFCGRIMDPVKHTPFTKLFHNNNAKILRRFDYKYFMGSAHVLSREAIKKIGGYDERFGVGSKYYGAEESDIFFRLKSANEKVIYLPDLVFFHIIPDVTPRYVYNYAYAVGGMLTKQILNDPAYFYIYLQIIMMVLLKNFIRITQGKLFPKAMANKTRRYKYSSALQGMIKGIFNYMKSR